jgi:ribosome-binding protein aMBF1 (putative translation factor)
MRSYLANVVLDPCAYCGAPAAQLDHIEPRAHNGEDGWENLTAACTTCNQSKGAKPLLTFLLHHNRPLTAAQEIKRLFGANVRDRRRAMGISQAALADSMGVDHMALSRWERGSSTPRAGAAVALSKALGVSLAWLYQDHTSDEQVAA